MGKTICLMGSTGSIGTQTLDVCARLGISVASLAARRNVDLMESQIRAFRPPLAAMSDEDAARELRRRLADLPTKILSGESGVLECARAACDIVLNAVVGRAGVPITLDTAARGGILALANKESLVCAGERVMALARERGAVILPVDSEHSAIFQCLRAADGNTVKRVLLTASGGAFLGRTRGQLEGVTPEMALRHPNWSMGSRVTVDSATLMNKGLELIEAMRLFSLLPEQVHVLVHPQSIVHSAVEFCDGSVIAQLASPDMRLPIQYALTYPRREKCAAPPLDLTKLGALTFLEPDYDTFPCLALAIDAARYGDAVCAALCDADEEAVRLFLAGELSFTGIYEYVKNAVDAAKSALRGS